MMKKGETDEAEVKSSDISTEIQEKKEKVVVQDDVVDTKEEEEEKTKKRRRSLSSGEVATNKRTKTDEKEEEKTVKEKKKIVGKTEKNGHDVDAKKKGNEKSTVKPRHVVVDPTDAAAMTQVLAPVANTVLMSNERWICPFCSFNNAARNTQCGGHGPLGCNAPRTAAGAMGGMQGSQSQVVQAQRWVL
eukprot:g3881.t1